MPNSSTIPQKHNRLLFIDALRGFALIGILLANLMSFMGFYSLSFEQITQLAVSERTILFLIDWLVESKFYAIFSILFGFSFVLFQRKYQTLTFQAFWRRRVLALLLIGILHMYFIWHGDILTLYSLVGFTLLWFHHFSNRSLSIIIGLLLLCPFAIHILYSQTVDAPFWGSLRQVSADVQNHYGLSQYSQLELRTSDNAFHVFMANIISAIPRGMSYIITGRIPIVLAYFLIGLLLARRFLPLLETGELKKYCSTKLTVIILFVGLTLSAYYAYIKLITGSPFDIGVQGFFQNVAQIIGALLLALAYILLLLKLYYSGACQGLFKGLATLGKMALTNYLTQTTLCVFIFYGYGFALMGKLNYNLLPLITIGIIGLQYSFSAMWLKYYRSGPLELLWKFIYTKRA